MAFFAQTFGAAQVSITVEQKFKSVMVVFNDGKGGVQEITAQMTMANLHGLGIGKGGKFNHQQFLEARRQDRQEWLEARRQLQGKNRYSPYDVSTKTKRTTEDSNDENFAKHEILETGTDDENFAKHEIFEIENEQPTSVFVSAEPTRASEGVEFTG